MVGYHSIHWGAVGKPGGPIRSRLQTSGLLVIHSGPHFSGQTSATGGCSGTNDTPRERGFPMGIHFRKTKQNVGNTMHRLFSWVLLATPFFFALPTLAQQGVVASDADLAATTARGRLLYEYDQAAWHASDAVLALHPPKETLGQYIAQKRDARWVVVFGHLKDARDAFLISAQATQGSSPTEFTAEVFDTPHNDAAFFQPLPRLSSWRKGHFRGQELPITQPSFPRPVVSCLCIFCARKPRLTSTRWERTYVF